MLDWMRRRTARPGGGLGMFGEDRGGRWTYAWRDGEEELVHVDCADGIVHDVG